jgi:succinoglycan biosynthesis transport protein ExoP
MNATAEQTGRLSLRDVLVVIFSKLHVLIATFVTILGVTLAVAFFTDPIYKVTANLLIKPVLEPTIKLQAPTPTHLSAHPVTVQDINSEVNILGSPQLLRQLVQKLDLAKEEAPKGHLSRLWSFFVEESGKQLVKMGLTTESSPEDRAILALQKRLEIKPITLSNMIEVTMTGTAPELITKTVNVLLDDYVVHHTSLFRAKGAKEFYARQADIFANSLRVAEDNLEKFKEQWSVVEIAAQNSANIALLRMMKENLALVQAQIAERQTKTATQKQNLAKTGNIGAFTKEFQTPILEELIRAMGPLLAERERIGIQFQEDSPKYTALHRQVLEIQRAYDKQIRQILNGTQLDLDALIHYADAIEKSIQSIERQSLLLSQKQVELDRLIREVKQNEENYLLYLKKTEEARMEEQQDTARVSNVSVTRWAETPTIPVFPRKLLMIVLALILGGLMGVAGAFITYYLDHTVKTPVDIVRYCRMPVLASIPLVSDHPEVAPKLPQGESQTEHFPQTASPPAGQKRAAGFAAGQGPPLWMSDPQRFPLLLEGFRTLKTGIQPFDPAQGKKLLLITGSDRQVGTSTVAFNLALVLAWDFLDQPILLVDSDVVNPSLHQAFGGDLGPGLMSYLTEDQPLERIVRTSLRPNLDLIPAGRSSPHILSPFDLKRFATFLDEVRQRYAYVVIDSGPILRSSDARTVLAKVDAAAVAVEAGRSRHEVINEIKSQVSGNTALLGCVLNKRRFLIPRSLYSHV